MTDSLTHEKMLPKRSLLMSQRDSTYLKQLQARYRRASKKEKTVILDEYVKTTG